MEIFNVGSFGAGDLDPAFNSGQALVLKYLYGERSAANDVAIGSDGRIYIVGDVGSGNTQYAIVCLNENGSFSEAFNNGQPVIHHFGGTNYSVVGDRVIVRVDENNQEKIFVLGRSMVLKGGQQIICPSIARFNLDGSRDVSFGVDGYSIISPDFEDGNPDFMTVRNANWQAYQSKIYLAAMRVSNNIGSVVVACMDLNGHLDVDFGNDGVAVVINPNGTGGTQLDQVLCTPLGIYLGGVMVSGAPWATIAKLHWNGSIDISFGNNGFWTEQAYKSTINALAKHQNGNVLTFGTRETDQVEPGWSFHDGLLRVLDHNGEFDASFNDGKPMVTHLGDDTQWTQGVVQTDRCIVASGRWVETFSDIKYRRVIARFKPDGTLDNSFGPGGRGWISFGLEPGGLINAIAVQTNNSIVVVGNTSDAPDHGVIIVRFKG